MFWCAEDLICLYFCIYQFSFIQNKVYTPEEKKPEGSTNPDEGTLLWRHIYFLWRHKFFPSLFPWHTIGHFKDRCGPADRSPRPRARNSPGVKIASLLVMGSDSGHDQKIPQGHHTRDKCDYVHTVPKRTQGPCIYKQPSTDRLQRLFPFVHNFWKLGTASSSTAHAS